MKKFPLLILAVSFCLQLNAQNGYEVEKNMPVFFEQMKASLNFELARENNMDISFDAWHAKAYEGYLKTLLPAPPMGDFNASIIDSESREGYTAYKVALDLTFTRVNAYLLVPDGVSNAPAVVLYHDHGAHFSIGKEKLVRPFGVGDEVLDDAAAWVAKCYDGEYVGDYFASNGYVVFVTDALFWGERGRKEGVNYETQQALASNFFQMGSSWGAQIIWDDLRSVDYVATLPYVDPSRIAVLGFSVGSHRAFMAAAASEKVAAAVAVCWMSTTESLMSLDNNQNKGGSAYSTIIPGLRNILDYPHVASLIAPRPMLFMNGLKDKLFPIDGVQSSYDTMHKVWDEVEPTNLVTTFYDVPHFFSKQMLSDALFFLNSKL